jgi:tetratricopeptide (TPR) repeat protein
LLHYTIFRKFIIHFVTVIVGILASNNLYSQDTLSQVHAFRNTNELEEALTLLLPYSQNHPNDWKSQELLAETYYWLGENDKAIIIYKREIQKNPSLRHLNLGLTKALINMGKLREAKGTLSNFISVWPDHDEALSLMGTLYYWEGNYRASKRYLHSSLQINPSNLDALDLLQTIIKLTSKNVGLGYHYSSDDQPLKKQVFTAFYNQIISGLFSPNFSIDYSEYRFSNKKISAPNIYISNSSEIKSAGVQLNLGAGVYANQNDRKNLLGHISIGKNIGKNLAFNLQYASKIYKHTLESIDSDLGYKEKGVKSIITFPQFLLAELSYTNASFNDENEINTAYSWILFTPLNINRFSASFGYSYHYTDAKNNNFSSTKSLETIIIEFELLQQIEGIYSPYYTPEKMSSHSLIIQLNWNMAKGIRLDGKFNYGFSAKAENPYLFLDQNGSDLFINKAFYNQEFTPLEININALIKIKEKISLTLGFEHFKSLFYTENSFHSALHFNFYEK